MPFDITLHLDPGRISHNYVFAVRERLLSTFSNLETHPLQPIDDEDCLQASWEICAINEQWADVVILGYVDSISLHLHSIPKITHSEELAEIRPLTTFLQTLGYSLENSDSVLQDYEAQTLRVWKVQDMVDNDGATP